MRKAVVFLLGIISTSSLALAQVPAGNVYFGYTYYNTDLSLKRGNLNGFQATLEGKLVPMLGIVADITGHYGSLEFPTFCSLCTGPTYASANAHQYEVMFGPRISIPAGKFRPFAEAELGVGHVTESNSSNTVVGFGSATSYATALGGGLDYKIFGPVAWRLEADYVRTHFFSVGQNNFRFSTGVSIRF
jgi:opacity protein-like surface antigen